MTVAWHIVTKDLVRLRWILVLWAVVLLGGASMVAIQAGLDANYYLAFYVVATVVLSGFSPLITVGLVMGLLHDDSVAEIDAFWITRPISSGELLQAKALVLALFGFIPVIVALPFWIHYDYGWTQIAGATLHTLRSYCVIVVVALPLAAISANGSKFVLNVIIIAGGLLLLMR